jgi:hypothetical protein
VVSESNHTISSIQRELASFLKGAKGTSEAPNGLASVLALSRIRPALEKKFPSLHPWPCHHGEPGVPRVTLPLLATAWLSHPCRNKGGRERLRNAQGAVLTLSQNGRGEKYTNMHLLKGSPLSHFLLVGKTKNKEPPTGVTRKRDKGQIDSDTHHFADIPPAPLLGAM